MRSQSQEFQAVVLAGGKGSRMMDLTQSTSKCFLPIGNYPMVWYPLNMLQAIGFQDVIVVTSDKDAAQMQNLPKKYGLNINLNVVTLSDRDDDGTAEALRKVFSQITAENIMVVSSDLILDVNQVRRLTDLHRIHRSSVTSLFSPVEQKHVQVPGPKSKEKPEKDFVGIDKENSQLCFLSSEADFNERVSFKRCMLRQHSALAIHSNLLDAHFYIIERGIAKYLYNDREITAIKGELIPFLVRQQFRLHKRPVDVNKREEDEEEDAAKRNNVQDLESCICPDELADEAQSYSCWNDHSGDLEGAYRNRLLKCYAHIIDRSGLCFRVNNMVTYCDVARNIQQLWPRVVGTPSMTQHHQSAKIQSKAVIEETLVGEETVISDRTTINNCSIGSNCKIEEKVRLSNCIIMDNVTVKSGSNLQGLIICEHAVISEKCEIKDSIIGHHYTVQPNAKISNEVVYQYAAFDE